MEEILCERDARVALVIIRNSLQLKDNPYARDNLNKYAAALQKWDRLNCRKGKWFPTYSGWRYWPEDPRPGDFNIEDIATALAGTCRFNAHLDCHYSVAQHCVLMSELSHSSGFGFECLMHDAPEAYLHDIATPVKRLIGREYGRLTDACWEAMASQFRINVGHEAERAVKWWDDEFLRIEARDVFPLRMIGDGVKFHEMPTVDFQICSHWSRDYAKGKFLERFQRYRPEMY